MSRTRLTLLAGVSGAALLLAGCEDSTFLKKPEGEASSGSTRPAATRLVDRGSKQVDRDIEAPEVFKTAENGLWDGRPSLGGVWVAHPDVKDPERVMIKNEVNGQFVIGALFRRERDNPGPSLQVSSDAAASLGLVAGQPTRLNVVALRREEEKPSLGVDERAISDNAQPTDAQPTDADTIAEPERIAAAPIASADAVAEATDTAAGNAAAAIEAPPQDAPRKRWNPFRRKEAQPDPVPAPLTETETLASADPIAVAPLTDQTLSVENIQTVAAPPSRPREEQPAVASLEPRQEPRIAPDAAPARNWAWNPFRRKSAEPANALRPEALTEMTAAGTTVTPQELEITRTALPAAATRSPAPTSTQAVSGKAFVQIGIFSLEDNANSAAETMRRNGVVPTVTKSSSQGKPYWRVVVGPSANGSDRIALVRKVKRLGFSDAFAVAR